MKREEMVEYFTKVAERINAKQGYDKWAEMAFKVHVGRYVGITDFEGDFYVLVRTKDKAVYTHEGWGDDALSIAMTLKYKLVQLPTHEINALADRGIPGLIAARMVGEP